MTSSRRCNMEKCINNLTNPILASGVLGVASIITFVVGLFVVSFGLVFYFGESSAIEYDKIIQGKGLLVGLNDDWFQVVDPYEHASVHTYAFCLYSVIYICGAEVRTASAKLTEFGLDSLLPQGDLTLDYCWMNAGLKLHLFDDCVDTTTGKVTCGYDVALNDLNTNYKWVDENNDGVLEKVKFTDSEDMAKLEDNYDKALRIAFPPQNETGYTNQTLVETDKIPPINLYYKNDCSDPTLDAPWATPHRYLLIVAGGLGALIFGVLFGSFLWWADIGGTRDIV